MANGKIDPIGSGGKVNREAGKEIYPYYAMRHVSDSTSRLIEQRFHALTVEVSRGRSGVLGRQQDA